MFNLNSFTSNFLPKLPTNAKCLILIPNAHFLKDYFETLKLPVELSKAIKSFGKRESKTP